LLFIFLWLLTIYTAQKKRSKTARLKQKKTNIYSHRSLFMWNPMYSKNIHISFSLSFYPSNQQQQRQRRQKNRNMKIFDFSHKFSHKTPSFLLGSETSFLHFLLSHQSSQCRGIGANFEQLDRFWSESSLDSLNFVVVCVCLCFVDTPRLVAWRGTVRRETGEVTVADKSGVTLVRTPIHRRVGEKSWKKTILVALTDKLLCQEARGKRE
jgi:hypothetical protein